MKFKDFEEFWPFYLSQHQNRVCRKLHFVGVSLAIPLVLLGFFERDLKWVILAPVVGYFFAWIGHFGFEKNRPATFQFPLWSLRGDVRMYFRMWTEIFK
jgi:hypothetical protein